MTTAAIEVGAILIHLIKQLHISEAELARQIGIPRATINRLVSGRTPDPRASTLNAIAEFFNISVDQLIGKQPLFFDNHQSLTSSIYTSIPIININETKNWVEVIRRLKPDCHFEWLMADPSIDKGKFAIRVKGESMWPQFQENTLLVIDPTKEAQNRDFVIAYLKENDEIVFRQLIIEDRYKFLKAINTIFPTTPLVATDIVIGVVIQTRKNYG